MRYIGSKENLLPFLDSIVADYGFTEGTFCDLFAGTTAVGRHFKRKGFRVISNDLMRYAFVFGKAYIENNSVPQFHGLELPTLPHPARLLDDEFSRLESVLAYLNDLPQEQDFIFNNYSDKGTIGKEHTRMYFSASNAGRIDATRNQIETWIDENKITDLEFYVLLASLLEAIPGVSNITGTYGSFLKYWESRTYKKLMLSAPPILSGSPHQEVYQCDATCLAKNISCDVLYLDPPYNGRQYAPNYHILETVACWDEPKIYGKSGMRPYKNEKSAYCNAENGIAALQELVTTSRFNLLMLSYNSEGIMPHDAICAILEQAGKLCVREKSYRRFRSDSDSEIRQYKPGTHIIERVYIVEAN